MAAGLQSDELRAHRTYGDNFENDDGYIDADLWEVERIVEERGSGKAKEFKVKWAHWQGVSARKSRFLV